MDEVHERDCNTDFLLILIRELVRASPQIKVVLMSATVAIKQFEEYFSSPGYNLSCRHIHVEGAMFPIHVHYLPDIIRETPYIKEGCDSNDDLRYYYQLLMSELHENHGDSEVSETEEEIELKLNPTLQCQNCGKIGFESPVTFGIHASTCKGQNQSLLDDGCTFEDVWGLEQANSSDEESDARVTPPSLDSSVGLSMNGTSERNEDVRTLLSDKVETDITLGEGKGESMECDSMDEQYQDLLMKVYQYSRQMQGLKDTEVDIGLLFSILEFIHRNDDDMKVFYNAGNTITFGHKPVRPSIKADRSTKGAVLIFVAGWADICQITAALELHPIFGNGAKYKIYPLHSGVSTSNQSKVFRASETGVRKIVVSTNIAETSVTIDDIVYVIDTGLHKCRNYDPYCDVSSLLPQYISKASSRQRGGRAGRCREGVCFRMYSKQRYESFVDETVPEIQRIPLIEVCLQVAMILKSRQGLGSLLSIPEKLRFDAIIPLFLSLALDPPSLKSIVNAQRQLYDIGALNAKFSITTLGTMLARLPLHPSMGKMLLLSKVLGFVEHALTLCAFHSVSKDPFLLPKNKGEKEAQLAERRRTLEYSDKSNSDHVIFLRLWKLWCNSDSKSRLCRQLGIDISVMQSIRKTRAQLIVDLEQVNKCSSGKLNSFAGMMQMESSRDYPTSNDFCLLQALICVGTYPNVAVLKPGSVRLKTQTETGVRIHNSSVVQVEMSSEHLWFVFERIMRSTFHSTVQRCTQVLPFDVIMFTGPISLNPFISDKVLLQMGQFAQVGMVADDANSMIVLKARFDDALTKILAPGRDGSLKKVKETIGLICSLASPEKKSVRILRTSGSQRKLPSRKPRKPRNDRKICQHHLRGSCRFGMSCKFTHFSG